MPTPPRAVQGASLNSDPSLATSTYQSEITGVRERRAPAVKAPVREPALAAQMMRPLGRLLDTLPNVPDELKRRFAAIETSDRIPFTVGLELVNAAVEVTGDHDLGLRSALYADPRDFEVLEWVATSAETWADACKTICRYVRVLSEVAEYRVEMCGDKVHIIFGSMVPLPRLISDFQLAVFQLAMQRWFPSAWPELAVWMKQEQPADLSGYRRIFPNCKLVFRAAFDGFVYDARRLEIRLPTADRERHSKLRAQVDNLMAELAPIDSIVARVSVDILETLRDGHVAAERTANRLGMARRTLVRRLNQHGTSFSELLKEVRYRTAIHYLQNSSHSVEDIAFLLGYSECAPFVRAFKRWSGRAPFEYRRLHR